MAFWGQRHDWMLLTGVLTALLMLPVLASAQQKSMTKPESRPEARPEARREAAPAKGPRGAVEKYDCKIGTEDRHARIAILAQGGSVQSVAYYSKWKPRTCSVHLERSGAHGRWSDTGDATTITTEFGDFLIQVSRGEYQLFFREVDRMHYCGMMGKLNGSMTVTRGPKSVCSVEGIMQRDEEQEFPAETEGTAPARSLEETLAK